MDEFIVWVIIIGFYAPLHYLLPVLVLFITGRESERARRRMIGRAVRDATLSMVVAFAIVIWLVQQQRMSAAMFVLLLSMAFPLVGIWRQRREIGGSAD